MLNSVSHSGPLCPLAETVLSLFAPEKELVIISLAIKLNHIPGKGNVAAFFFFFNERECIFGNPDIQLLLVTWPLPLFDKRSLCFVD